MIPLAALALVACLPIDASSDRITAGDLARILPEWGAAAPDTAISLAPAPGVVRMLRIAELRRLASRFGVEPDAAADICFQRPVAPVPPERMLAIMQAQLPDAHIKIIESTRVPAPDGDLQFPLSGLRPGYWFGNVTYGGGHKFVVWARVNVTTSIKRVVASVDLCVGQPIDPMQLHIEAQDEFPARHTGEAGVTAIEELAGRVPRRAIRAGTVVQKEWLEAPRLVQRGETVKVQVVSGLTKLETEGIAEASGAFGETISVQNPDSKRRFRAQVESKGRVSVRSSL